MSIHANNYILDKNTGEIKLLRHLNKLRVDRGLYFRRRKRWNKSGIKGRSSYNLLNRQNRRNIKNELKEWQRK